MKAKWFYPLQAVAEKRLSTMYPDCEKQCVFQVVSKDRVLEQWRVFTFKEEDGNFKDVLVHMINNTDEGTLLMYEMEFVASN